MEVFVKWLIECLGLGELYPAWSSS